MTLATFELPDEAIEDPRRLLEATVCSLWSQGKIGGGRAGKLLGMSRPEFWHFAGSRGYTWPYTVEDLEQDIETMKKLGQW